MAPKVFISYSWSSSGHQAFVKGIAEQLVGDGVDVVLDIFDLKEGHDKFAFMERMVTDASVTHVLVISDKAYSEKADSRKSGVGTESQIISKEVYDKIEQSKFIPIACEFDNGEPFLPTFLKNRMWINFSTPEAKNENWEKLIRLLFGKPLHEKPKLGNPPAYILDNSAAPSSPAIAKFATLKQAILQGKPGIELYRKEFLDACVEFADSMRIRSRPTVNSIGERILEDSGKLKQVRNQLIDWVLLEASTCPTDSFRDSLIDLLERLRELKTRPPELNQWNESWFEAHSLFVYETFIYIVAALLRTNAFKILHDIFTTHYLMPESARHGDTRFEKFECFYGYGEAVQSALSPEGGTRYRSPGAELIKRQSDRSDITFGSVIQAELLILMMAFITPDARWYPQTLNYASYGRDFPFFIRASQHKNFKNLVEVTGIADADKLRELVQEGQKRLNVQQWHDFNSWRSFCDYMNLDNLDTIK